MMDFTCYIKHTVCNRFKWNHFMDMVGQSWFNKICSGTLHDISL